MSSNCFSKYLKILTHAICNLLQRLTINLHQLATHWRIRIKREQRAIHTPTASSISSEVKLSQLPPEIIQTDSGSSSNIKTKFRGPISPPSGRHIKTPNPSRLKIYQFFRRLSVRNFMEYCVIALNEASSSSCSNKFDLTNVEQPVWLLGQQYNLPQDAEKLVDDIRSKLWITYRRNFPPIDENIRYTTDRGFGCMIRCGQMVLANALIQKNLGRHWRWLPDGLDSNPEIYGKILKLFQDKEDCPYSIHNIIRVGQQEGKVVGEWFGPNTIAQALKRISSNSSFLSTTSDELLISIDAALDNIVVIDEIKKRFKSRGLEDQSNESSQINKSSSELGDEKNNGESGNLQGLSEWLPGIMFIQLRLGLSKINPLYFAALKKTFQFKNSLGIIGGRPNHALYLVGYTNDDIIYLDPHSTQVFVDFDSKDYHDQQTDESKTLPIDGSYHCACPEKMSLDRLDPSLALCFYFHTEQEFDEWCELSNNLLIKSEQAPMFEITKSRPSHWNIPLTSTIVKSCDVSGCGSSGQNETNSVAIKDSSTNSINTNDAYQGSEKFTILKVSDEDDAFDIKTVDRNTSDQSQATNDDEEFEMLG